MSDAQPRETAILDRGEYLKPTEKVSFATPAFLPPHAGGAPANRLGLAQWLVMPEHPLTARVQVNRMWQHFFGTGIVKTSEDFGVQSEYPIHGELLDWLAVEFRERGWSMKAMHRLIVTSATYRQSSRVTPEHRARDLENRLYRAGEPVPDAVADSCATGRSRPPACSTRRIGGPPGLSLSARRDLGGPGHHQGARLHLPGLLGRRPLSPQPLHVLAADGRRRPTCSTPRTGRPAACGRDDQHAAARPHHAQRPDLGRGRAGPGRAEHESVGRASTAG